MSRTVQAASAASTRQRHLHSMPAPTHIPAGTEALSGWASLIVVVLTALALAAKPVFSFGRWIRARLFAPTEQRMDRLEKGYEELHTDVKAIVHSIQRMETNCAAHCPGTTNGTPRPTEVNGFPHQIGSVP